MMRREGTVEEQIKLEKLKEEEGINKHTRDLNKAIERGDYSNTIYGKLLAKLGYDVYVDKLEEYLTEKLYTHQKKERDLLLLISDDMKTVAFIAITECINGAVKKKSLTSTAIDIVSKLRDIYLLNKLSIANPKLKTYLGEKYRKASTSHKRQLLKKHIDKLYTLGDNEKEDKPLMTQLGARLINILELSGSNIIYVHKDSYVKNGRKVTKSFVSLTEEAGHIITNLEFSDFIFNSINKLPMVVPPKDWSNNYDGGFYRGKNFLFITKSSDVSKHLKSNTYPKLYKVVNKLQKTAWRVNIPMLELVSSVFNDNMVDPKSPTKAPTLYGGLPLRDPYTWKDFIKQEDFDKWHDFNREREDIDIRAKAEASKRLDLIYTLRVAEKMQKYTHLYYPYVFDYRGRVYSDVNFLTPQGQSYTKSLLEFAEGRRLDSIGEYWLQIHIANVYGHDKLEYEERLSWFKENEDMILSVGINPLNNKAEWVWCDSPFEFVAGCMAWADHRSGMEVHLPIQLDATCSGIQMYSGLLRDRPGAESVNVIGNTRNDIYQIVADKVNRYLSENKFSQWIEYTDREGVEKSVYAVPIGKSMEGKITRKIVKRNVMTVPYSVTRKGMSNQIWDMIDEAILKGKEFWEGDKWVANKIITQLNHTAIYDTIEGAKVGQEYLVALSRTLDVPAKWNGVLYDFPLKQTSLTLTETRVRTPYGRLQLNIEVPKLNKRRQSNSIAPNFIHNIDSTILLYCIENMEEQIGVIHDCFLTHPNDGYKIQAKYKEGFVKVMELDPLRNIQRQLDPDHEVEFPEYGDLDLDEIYDSKYIIS